jgi:NAD(P)-dependent dehydrogenase (short-subunit alcohol dehydrogenase family)
MGAARWQTAIVTGAASGIGRCFGETLARHGTAVGLLDVSAEGLVAAVAAMRTTGARVETRVADVSAASAVTTAIEELGAALGGIHLVVHCAAILGPGHFAEQAVTQFDRVVHINLLGTANVLRAARPALRQSKGAVACLVSASAVHGWPALGAYSASKCGVSGLCDAVRPELAREGIGLTAVYPLLIDTPLLRAGDVPPILRHGRRLPAETVVRKTLAGVAAGRARVFIPGTVRLIAAFHALAPSLLDRYGRRVGIKKR